MTFEQWWAQEKWDGIDVATVEEAAILRRIAATCWNEAVEACADICGDAEGVDFGMTERLKVKL